MNLAIPHAGDDGVKRRDVGVHRQDHPERAHQLRFVEYAKGSR